MRNLELTGSGSFFPQRQQLFALGVKYRNMYGQLLDAPALSSKKRNLPVFRTESQDRMTKSSLNFAAGFFGSKSPLGAIAHAADHALLQSPTRISIIS